MKEVRAEGANLRRLLPFCIVIPPPRPLHCGTLGVTEVNRKAGAKNRHPSQKYTCNYVPKPNETQQYRRCPALFFPAAPANVSGRDTAPEVPALYDRYHRARNRLQLAGRIR